MRDNIIPAMTRVRAVVDRLEKVLPDDLWPLPRYREMLFIR
jgi:glutamine synthetase